PLLVVSDEYESPIYGHNFEKNYIDSLSLYQLFVLQPKRLFGIWCYPPYFPKQRLHQGISFFPLGSGLYLFLKPKLLVQSDSNSPTILNIQKCPHGNRQNTVPL